MAIPKKLRLTKKIDFQTLFANSTVVYTLFARVLISKNSNNLKNPRFAIIVSKSVDKRAVYRNKIRRSITAEIQKNIHNKSPLSYDYIFIVKKTINLPNKNDIVKEIARIVKYKI